jgi:D-alanine transaminase
VLTLADSRWSQCFIKAVTLLPNVLAKNEALARGYDEALFVTPTGEIRECTSSNVFLAQGKTLFFPVRTESILHGVTQGFLIECARAIGLGIEERELRLSDLMRANEAFLSSTVAEVLGITSVDDQPIGSGQVGPLTKQMYQEFVARSRG